MRFQSLITSVPSRSIIEESNIYLDLFYRLNLDPVLSLQIYTNLQNPTYMLEGVKRTDKKEQKKEKGEQ